MAVSGLEAATDGGDVGRDPRTMSHDELRALGHQPMSPMKAIRTRCLDCCADQPGEVRKCTAVTCPSWPFRMGKNPWRAKPSEARQEAARRLAPQHRNQRQERAFVVNSNDPAPNLPDAGPFPEHPTSTSADRPDAVSDEP